MKKLEHLSEIYSFYDTFVIDLWGVMHNGILLNNKAMQAINKLLEESVLEYGKYTSDYTKS